MVVTIKSVFTNQGLSLEHGHSKNYRVKTSELD